MDKPRTPQQKGLDFSAFDVLSTTISDDTDDILEHGTIECINENYEDSPISENFYRKISISATEKMRMREVLTRMADLAGLNIFIAQDIDGNISFSAKNRAFLDILKDICSSSGLKYTISENSVKIEYDSPMLKFYKLPSLNIQRDTRNSMAISTDIFNNGMITGDFESVDNKSNTYADNGSNSVVSGMTRNDFWSELEMSLKTIIGGENNDGSYVSVHRQAGVITAYTTQSKHEEIAKYLRLLKDTSEAQVLIEAKIIEVNLKDEFKSGINWNFVRQSGGIEKSFDTVGLFTAQIRDKASAWTTTFGLIEKFGAVKTLSSPRITILNNHSAILKVAQNEVVYLPEFQKQYNGNNSDYMTDMLSANMKSIPIGLIMSVQPSIDTKQNTILLNIRPTISKIVRYKDVPFLFNNYIRRMRDSPSSSMQLNPQVQKVPIVDVREMDSVLKLRSGQVVVMGGLMHEKSNNNRDGLPGFYGNPIDVITSERDRGTEVTELVIFLRATILGKNKRAYHKADETIYNTFANDPRKLRFKNENLAKK